MFAEIIIPIAVPKNYTWWIPEELEQKVQIGIRVEVSLRNKKYTGIICNLHENQPEAFTPKPILGIIDEEPLLHAPQLKLWQWIAAYYMCTQGEVMHAAVPSYFKLNSESIIVFNEEYGDDFSLLSNEEYLVAEALFLKKELTLTEIQGILDSRKIYPIIKQLALKKICYIWESLKDRFVPKKEIYIVLNPLYDNDAALSDLLNNWTKAPKQMELLLAYLHLLKTEGNVTKKELLNKAGATDAQLKGLIDKTILIAEKKEVNRLPQLPFLVQMDFTLNDEQEAALNKIETAFAKNENCLLFGITGSGKTLLYVKLLEKIIRDGKQALYLVPEIALTTQLIRRLQKHFGGYIAVYHSRFSDNERVELWNKVKTGATKIILGARSALLLPFIKLDLIIIDEEHEPSYKQYEPAPRYHARDTAIFYAHQCNAKIILGSATPSVETFYNVSLQKLTLVTLEERYGSIALPEIEIIDTKIQNKLQKEKTILSDPLKEEIAQAIANKKQVILFKNRRGYSPYKICSTCGWMPECKHCNVALTYHKNKNHLICHYCNTIYPTIHTCLACGGKKFEQKNFGTEKVEEAISEFFPDARVARMDLDSLKGKHAHNNLIQQFELGKIDILVGTQMLVKGLDFEDVHLVGILDADSLLHFADFRVHERAFQLMEQVSGRAGRKNKQGKVLIQATQNNHPLLQYIKNHDYTAFYQQEIAERKQFFYPPFSRLILVQFKNKEEAKLQKAADYFVQHLQEKFRKYLIGPAAPYINKIRNQFILEVLFKLPKDTATINECKAAIQQQIAILQNTREFSNVILIPNVDPV